MIYRVYTSQVVQDFFHQQYEHHQQWKKLVLMLDPRMCQYMLTATNTKHRYLLADHGYRQQVLRLQGIFSGEQIQCREIQAEVSIFPNTSSFNNSEFHRASTILHPNGTSPKTNECAFPSFKRANFRKKRKLNLSSSPTISFVSFRGSIYIYTYIHIRISNDANPLKNPIHNNCLFQFRMSGSAATHGQLC